MMVRACVLRALRQADVGEVRQRKIAEAASPPVTHPRIVHARRRDYVQRRLGADLSPVMPFVPNGHVGAVVEVVTAAGRDRRGQRQRRLGEKRGIIDIDNHQTARGLATKDADVYSRVGEPEPDLLLVGPAARECRCTPGAVRLANQVGRGLLATERERGEAAPVVVERCVQDARAEPAVYTPGTHAFEAACAGMEYPDPGRGIARVRLALGHAASFRIAAEDLRSESVESSSATLPCAAWSAALRRWRSSSLNTRCLERKLTKLLGSWNVAH